MQDYNYNVQNTNNVQKGEDDVPNMTMMCKITILIKITIVSKITIKYKITMMGKIAIMYKITIRKGNKENVV